MFKDGLEEFDDSRSVQFSAPLFLSLSSSRLELTSSLFSLCRNVVQELVEEYRSCEQADYVDYGSPATGPGEREPPRG